MQMKYGKQKLKSAFDVRELMMFILSIKHTHFSFSYNFHQVNFWLQKFTIRVKLLFFPQKSLFIIFVCFEKSVSCLILAECTKLSANKISDENLNTIHVLVGMTAF